MRDSVVHCLHCVIRADVRNEIEMEREIRFRFTHALMFDQHRLELFGFFNDAIAHIVHSLRVFDLRGFFAMMMHVTAEI